MKRATLNRLLFCLLVVLFFIYSPDVYGFLTPESKTGRRFGGNRAKGEKVFLYSLPDVDRREFESRYGSAWKVILNPITGMASRLYGGKASLGMASGSHGLLNHIDQDILISSCKEFITQNYSLFNVKERDLELLHVRDKDWIRYVNFSQLHNEKTVYGSYLSFIINKNGEIVSINMNLFPDITINNTQLCDIEECQEIIKTDLQDNEYEILNKEIVVYPHYNNSESEIVYIVAGCLDIKRNSPLQKWRYLIDLHNMRIIEKNDLAHYIIEGNVKGKILPKYYNDAEEEQPLANLKISLLRADSPLYYNSFDVDPGWIGVKPLSGWGFGKPIPQNGTFGGPDPGSGHTGSYLYGYNLRGAYPLSMKEPQYLTMSHPIDCSIADHVGLTFWRWLGVEGSREDQATVEIWDETSAKWKKIWVNGRCDLYDGDWRLMFYDISQWASENQAVWLRWGMGPSSDYLSYCGWNIDDVGIYSTEEVLSNKYGQFTVPSEDSINTIIATLEGKYFRVINDDGANIIYSKGNTSENTHDLEIVFAQDNHYDNEMEEGSINALDDIDEINVYYHANKMVHYIQDIDPDFLNSLDDNFFPINITVRYGNRFNNAFWLLGEGLFFGEGDGFEFRNFSHFADIIYHEVTHAITDNIYGYFNKSNQRGLGGFDEFDAMHEAFSDYWACSLTDDSKIAEGGFWVFSAKDYVRNLENNFNYRFDYGYELYESSQILSGAMWNFRQSLKDESGALGVRVADTLFHFAREAGAKTFRDFLIDVLLVDELKYENAHNDLILDKFGEKGISLPPLPPTSVIVEKKSEGISIRWTKSLEAVGYCVYYQEQRGLSLSKENDEHCFQEDRRVDVGDRDNYLLTGLEGGEYIIKITAYDKYGVESADSVEKRFMLTESFTASSDGPWQVGYAACFLNSL